MATAARKVKKTDNLPPPLVTNDQLAADFLHLIQDVAELENECLDLPNVAEDDEDLAAITATGTRIIKLAKKLDDQKKDEKRPFLDANTALEAFFAHGLGATLVALKTNLEKVSTSYQRKKADRERVAREAIAAEALAKAQEAARQVQASVQAGDVKAVTAAVSSSNSLTTLPTGQLRPRWRRCPRWGRSRPRLVRLRSSTTGPSRTST
jgi:hypothetical protein